MQDGTALDLSSQRKMTGLGPTGKGTTQGLLLQTMLAVLPTSRQVLGCGSQEVCVRRPIPTGETRSNRRQRTEREPDVWMRLLSCVGSVPEAPLAVHVGDRGADVFGFFEACQSTKTQFLVPVAGKRRIDLAEDPQQYLIEQMRSWQPTSRRPFQVPASHGRTARMRMVHLAFGPVTILPPRSEKRYGTDPLSLGAIRVWEEQPSVEEEPVEWLLLTSVATTTLSHACERVGR